MQQADKGADTCCSAQVPRCVECLASSTLVRGRMCGGRFFDQSADHSLLPSACCTPVRLQAGYGTQGHGQVRGARPSIQVRQGEGFPQCSALVMLGLFAAKQRQRAHSSPPPVRPHTYTHREAEFMELEAPLTPRQAEM